MSSSIRLLKFLASATSCGSSFVWQAKFVADEILQKQQRVDKLWLNLRIFHAVILLSSGVRVTWANMRGNHSQTKSSLGLTFFSWGGAYFSVLQWAEYYEARFTYAFADSVYGSTFFLATGFHVFFSSNTLEQLAQVPFKLLTSELENMNQSTYTELTTECGLKIWTQFWKLITVEWIMA